MIFRSAVEENISKISTLETVSNCKIDVIIEAFMNGYLEIEPTKYLDFIENLKVNKTAEELSGELQKSICKCHETKEHKCGGNCKCKS